MPCFYALCRIFVILIFSRHQELTLICHHVSIFALIRFSYATIYVAAFILCRWFRYAALPRSPLHPFILFAAMLLVCALPPSPCLRDAADVHARHAVFRLPAGFATPSLTISDAH